MRMLHTSLSKITIVAIAAVLSLLNVSFLQVTSAQSTPPPLLKNSPLLIKSEGDVNTCQGELISATSPTTHKKLETHVSTMFIDGDTGATVKGSGGRVDDIVLTIKVSDSAKAGDSYVVNVKLPVVLSLDQDKSKHVVTSPKGEIIAHVTQVYNSDRSRSYKFTYTDYVNTHDNVTMTFSSMWSYSYNTFDSFDETRTVTDCHGKTGDKPLNLRVSKGKTVPQISGMLNSHILGDGKNGPVPATLIAGGYIGGIKEPGQIAQTIWELDVMPDGEYDCDAVLKTDYYKGKPFEGSLFHKFNKYDEPDYTLTPFKDLHVNTPVDQLKNGEIKVECSPKKLHVWYKGEKEGDSVLVRPRVEFKDNNPTSRMKIEDGRVIYEFHFTSQIGDSYLNKRVIGRAISGKNSALGSGDNRSRLGDYVWIDANKNGKQDSGEKPMPGVTVTIKGNGETHTLTTDAQGKYMSEWLSAGTYSVTFVAPQGYGFVGNEFVDKKGHASVTLKTGETNLNIDAGLYKLQPRLVVAKDKPRIDKNGNWTYHISVTNMGEGVSQPTTFVDEMSVVRDNKRAKFEGTWKIASVAKGNIVDDIKWQVPALKPGEKVSGHVVAKPTVKDLNSGIRNMFGLPWIENCVGDHCVVQNVGHVKVTKKQTGIKDGVVSYDVTVENKSKVSVKDIKVHDKLTQGLDEKSLVINEGKGYVIDKKTNIVGIKELKAGEKVVITLSAKAKEDATDYVNTVFISDPYHPYKDGSKCEDESDYCDVVDHHVDKPKVDEPASIIPTRLAQTGVNGVVAALFMLVALIVGGGLIIARRSEIK